MKTPEVRSYVATLGILLGTSFILSSCINEEEDTTTIEFTLNNHNEIFAGVPAFRGTRDKDIDKVSNHAYANGDRAQAYCHEIGRTEPLITDNGIPSDRSKYWVKLSVVTNQYVAVVDTDITWSQIYSIPDCNLIV